MKPFYKISPNSILCVGLLIGCFSFFNSNSQNAVVIGGNTPNPNAVLLLIGNGTQGLAIPTTNDPTSIAKVQGMIVYNKTDNKIYYSDGITWKDVSNSSGSSASQTLALNGNTLSISGANNVAIANTAPTQPGQVLMWDGSQWTASSSTAPTVTGQVLKWNNTTKSWEAGVDAGGTSYVAGTGISITGTTISNTGITSVTGTAPISVVSATTTPAISITQANTTTDGYLSKADWNTFNSKVSTTATPGGTTDIGGNFSTGLQIGAGTIVNADVNSTAAIAGTKISPDFGSQNIATTGKTVLNTVSYTWPGTQGAANTFLKNDGAGNVSWAAASGSSFSTDKTIPRGNGTTLVASQLYDDGTNVGVGTTSPTKKLDVNGDINIPTNASMYINGLRFINNAGFSNTAIGEEAGLNSSLAVTDAVYNLFVGWQSGKLNTKGQFNTFLAPGAGAANTTGSYNVYIGSDAGANINGNLNTFVGFNAGKASTTSISSTFIGNKAGEVNTTASYNTFLGERAGQASTTGEENTFVGRTSGLTNTTGHQNTILGSTADVGLNNLTNATAIGYGAVVGASNALVLGKTGTSVGIGTPTPSFLLDVNGSLRCFSFTNSSDIRWKKDITPINNSLNKVLALKGVEYSWRKDQLKNTNVDDRRQIGFIAQDVEKVIPELVSTDKDGFKSVQYANITAVLVEAVKEQQTQIETLRKTIEALEAKLKLYETKESLELSIIHEEIKKLNELVGLEAKAEKK